jgi:hypothetical protein
LTPAAVSVVPEVVPPEELLPEVPPAAPQPTPVPAVAPPEAAAAPEAPLVREEPVVVAPELWVSSPVAPVIDAAELGIPPAKVQRIEPRSEEPVQVEALEPATGRTISVQEDETQVVVVESGSSAFVPEPPPLLEAPQPAPQPESKVIVAPDMVGGPIDPLELEGLVKEILGDNPEKIGRARARLVALGGEAIPALMKHFPGRLFFDVGGCHDTVPPMSEHSELLRCLVEIGEQAAPAVAERLEASSTTARYYAVKVLGEIHSPRFVSRLARRLYDREARIRLAAIDTLQRYRRTPEFDGMLSDLRAKLRSDSPEQQAIAAALLGNFRDGDALAQLIVLVRSPQRMVARAAVESLSYITKQDFGTSERKWLKWWQVHKGEHRVQWLIDGLRSKNRDIRFSSSRELSQLTREYFGYYFDSDKDDRERAVHRWEAWWEEKGRQMHFDD